MSNEKLAEQLDKLKVACAKWEKELDIYSKWAKENDGVISATEQKEIDRRKTEIAAIKARIAQVEKAKGIQPKEKGFFGKLVDGAKDLVEKVVDTVTDIFDGNDSENQAPVTPVEEGTKPISTETKPTGLDNTKDGKPKEVEKPKNKLGITPEQVKDKLANFFAAFDKFTVVVAGTTVEVETPYFMNDGTASGPWDGNTVTAGKGSPKEVQTWLQGQIDKGKITSKDPAKLRQYLKDNKIGVDCSGFVSQALNHVADKEGDMEFEKGEDPFTPDATGSGSFTGNKFTKIEPANVQVGDTLYFKNAPGKVNHIRIVGDVRKENGVVYYTIFESAGSTGPRKMEWKFADAKLQEFTGGKWVVKTSETFYRWKELEMEVPSGGGAGEGQQQDQQEGGNEGTNTTTSTLSASVGQGGKNVVADVLLVKKLLNKVISAGLVETDVNVGPKTIAAIKKFQQEKAAMATPSGLIEPGSQSWKVLNGETKPQNGGGEQPQNNTEVEPILAPNSAIKQSVGAGGKNDEADVLLVKKLLNKFGYKLTEDGKADAALTTAIKDFQTKYRGATSPDGKIDPGGNTWSSLIGIGRIQGQLLAMAKQYGVEPAVILAIQQIESGGNGFLADGRPKILFEGHVFWSQLQKAGKNPQTYVKGNEDILYPSWDSTKYQGGAKEYDRLEKAKKIDEILALKSASWGEFQIMGFNHSTVGYPDVVSFVEAMKVPNGASLKALMEFCKNNNLLRHVNSATKDWAAFARGYNGPGYAKNQYDVKLAAAYERYKKLA